MPSSLLDTTLSTAPDQFHWGYEAFKCADDLDYLASTYLHIKSKEIIGFPKLDYNPVQRYLLSRVQDQLKRTGKIRQIWGKSRQIGASTLALSLIFQQTAFKNYRNAFIVSYDEPTSYERFDTIMTFYDALPAPLHPPTKYRAKAKIDFETRRSRILANHARNTNVGAGEMNHLVHLTEAARYPNPADLADALFPTISDASGEDFSAVIIESTSYFGGNWFKEMAEAAMRGETEYEFTFIPWHMHHLYNPTPPRDFIPTAEELDLKRQYKLTLGNLAWRRRKLAEFRTNPSLWFQSYPLSWEESWVLPSGTMNVFPRDLLGPTEPYLRPGTRCVPQSSGLIPATNGPLEVWQHPIEGRYYDLGIDVSEGRTENADWTVLEVVDRSTLEQVAEARLHINPASEDFIDLVYWTGMLYNTAQIIPDITGGWGHALITDLQKRDYPTLWQSRQRNDLKERLSNRIGFLYTKREKAHLVSNAVRATEREHPLIHSHLLFDELCHFLNVDVDEWSGGPGWHDDTVNAYMLALLAATDERMEAPAELPITSPHPGVERPWAFHDVEKDLGNSSPSPFLPWA